MNVHKNLFFLCENCSHPVIIPLALEIGVLPRTKKIQCPYCDHPHFDLDELKEYAKQSRQYTGY